MTRRSWLFESSLFSLKEFDALTPVFKMEFSKEAFWVHMHELPIGCMNEDMGEQMGKTIGAVKKCDIDKQGSGWRTTLHVLIEVDLKKPISRGRTINVLGNKHWIPLIYEKLLRICFDCGRVIHGEGSYKEGKAYPNNSSGQYGP